MRTKLIMLAGAAMSIAAATQALAQADANSTAVMALRDRQFGLYLVALGGTALYVFSGDQQNVAASACDATCQQTFMPFTTDFEPPSAGEGARGALVGMFSIGGGVSHITYNGWPLYLYVDDADSGDREAMGHEEFGGTWNLIGSEGEVIVPAAPEPAPVPAPGGFGGVMFPG